MTHLGSLQVPPNNKAKSFQDYVNLPITDSHCQSVDMTDGMWYFCSLCNCRVKGRAGRAWTTTRWNDHTVTDGHAKKSKSVDRIALLRDRRKKGQVICVCYGSFLLHMILLTI